MTTSEKQNLINKFEKLSNSFDDILNMPDELILYKPNKDSWSIKEHIVHCLDVDIANFHRYRKAIAEPESKIRL